MLAASSIQKPPMCSLVSRYGPSVTTTLPVGPFRKRLRAAYVLQAASKKPRVGSTCICFVKRVDSVCHRLILYGKRIVIVGVVNSNQVIS